MTLEEAKRLLGAFEAKKDNSNDGAFMSKLRAQIADMEEAERQLNIAMKKENDKWEADENKRRKELNLPPVTAKEKMARLTEQKRVQAETIEKAEGQELRAATERGRLAKQNQTFPTMRKTDPKYKTKQIVHVSPVSIIGSSAGILSR